jgi:hypothetical protein
MTNEQLTAYLQDESHLYTIGYEELKTLVMNYPYASNLRVLLLKKSHLDDHKDYDRNLQMAASYTTNRKHLYHSVRRLKRLNIVPQNVILGEDYLELTELSNIERLLGEKNATEIFVPESTAIALSQDWQFALDEPSVPFANEGDIDIESEIVIPPLESQNGHTEIDLSEKKKVETTEIEIIDFDQFFEENIVHRTPSDGEDGILIEEQVVQPDFFEKSDIMGIQAVVEKVEEHKPAEPSPRETPVPVSNEEPEPNPPKSNLVVMSFTEWLRQHRMTNPYAVSTSPSVVKSKTAEFIDNQTVGRELSRQHMDAVMQTEVALPENLFGLIADPVFFFDDEDEDAELSDDTEGGYESSPDTEKDKATKKRKKKRAMHSLAAKSIETDLELVSETLADLLVGQKNFDRAEEMYRQLITKYPEKGDYFAAKIKKMREA